MTASTSTARRSNPNARPAKSLERRAVLEQALSASAEDAPTTFLTPPVYQTNFARGYGTLYTVIYHPGECSAELIWPGAALAAVLRALS